MYIPDFSKITSTDKKIQILNILKSSKSISIFQTWKKLNGGNYKNTHEIFKEFYEARIIEEDGERKPPHYAIFYRLNKKGQEVLRILDKISII